MLDVIFQHCDNFFVYTLLFFEVCLTINLNKGKKFTFLMNFVVKPEVKKDEKWLPLKGSEKTNISLPLLLSTE